MSLWDRCVLVGHGSKGSVLSLWDRCVRVVHGSKGSDGKGDYWPGKVRLGRKCAEDWTGVSGTERWGLAAAARQLRCGTVESGVDGFGKKEIV